MGDIGYQSPAMNLLCTITIERSESTGDVVAEVVVEVVVEVACARLRIRGRHDQM
jgi:hypothetical protein